MGVGGGVSQLMGEGGSADVWGGRLGYHFLSVPGASDQGREELTILLLTKYRRCYNVL